MSCFRDRLVSLDPSFATIAAISTLQVNLGNHCNLACSHCHQAASPQGTAMMQRRVMERIAAILAQQHDLTVDITGGAPELHPDFRLFVEMTEGIAKKRILRSNLAVMTEPGMEWLADFCRKRNIAITASLPCYLQENVDAQRGDGAYIKSIQALQMLNRLGYGSELELNLVYNPGGRFLPPAQGSLESAYREELSARFGIRFSNLYTITNAPVGRFRDMLARDGKLESYQQLLEKSFNPAAAGAVMCRSLLSIDWQGIVYNCDFNQALGINLCNEIGTPLTVFDLQPERLAHGKIIFGAHCYCCTAGEGSSCSGALAA
jgi:radical SAM/Cys-rich protein